MIDPHLLFPILFIVAFVFWRTLHKTLINLFNKLEEKNADHQRR